MQGRVVTRLVLLVFGFLDCEHYFRFSCSELLAYCIPDKGALAEEIDGESFDEDFSLLAGLLSYPERTEGVL
eukprot:g4407.t1